MKVWLKLLIGSLLGIILGYILPYDNLRVLSILGWLEKMAIGIGRYGTVPILVFSLTIAIYELRQDGQFWGLLFRSFLLIVGSSVFVISAGILVTMVFPPGRIPILIEEQIELASLDVGEAVLQLFPSNMFTALFSDGVYLLPLCVFAFFLGMGLSYDRNYTKSVISLVDSLSRIFYHVASFFSEILGLIIIVLAAYWAIRFHGALQADVFRDLIALLWIFSALLGFVILPLLLYFLKPRVNPWVLLYGSLGPAIAAFFSGDINFSIPVIFRHVKENFGVRRRANTVTVTLFTAFGRAGSAMVAAAAFIVIIKSYSSLGVTLADVVSIGLRAVLISFLLARHSGNAAYIALAVLCQGYGRGFEAGYLILKPLAFYLIATGAFLDVMIACFASFALARASDFQEDREVRHFI
ncbi:putative transporter [Treponema primitia ZAS-2]|uniref:Putative transporter n=1 Tax=Treponema primitia (strain ATCC BAA-887 / DSM 12427 / ZAS-2) TaxID=545694 RepID=F5YQ71_TREPZ|nr:cation:dicarboxylase symporter family transporter [Treponema primitia]AEF84762.1 putative transporter [Treponema primitia ZAS-2]